MTKRTRAVATASTFPYHRTRLAISSVFFLGTSADRRPGSTSKHGGRCLTPCGHTGVRFSSSGSFAMLVAMRRASSRVRRLAAARRPGSCSKYTLCTSMVGSINRCAAPAAALRCDLRRSQRACSIRPRPRGQIRRELPSLGHGCSLAGRFVWTTLIRPPLSLDQLGVRPASLKSQTPASIAGNRLLYSQIRHEIRSTYLSS